MSSYKIDLQKEHLVFDADGVNFLSAHGSKGLEFEEVYILNCTEEGWEKKRDVALPYGMKYFIDNEADVNHEERRRLFYVAMTRAKTKLVLSHLNEKISDSSKMLARSLFVDEVMQDELAKNVKIELDALSVSDCIKRISYNPVLRTENIMEPTFLDEYLTGYQLSVSHLNNYLKCPTAFYFQNILRVPSAKNKYFSFGLAVHSALDQLIQLRSENASLFTRTKLLEFYENALWRERFVFNERAYEEFLSLGKELLAGYFDSNNERWLMIKDMQTEVKIDRIEVDGVPIKGQLDRLDLEGNSVAVVDYKTGDANNGKSKVNPPKNLVFDAKNSDLADVGGDYWRQIMFYGLLVNGDRTKNWQALSGQMDFIEPDKTGSLIQVKRMITSEAIDYMKGLVRAVYDKILHKEFSPGCQKEDCTWCQFVARNYTTHV
jgi:DNA helicase-2/ATP-dependent DNA helicase PcrA